jgi:hypothetical protein
VWARPPHGIGASVRLATLPACGWLATLLACGWLATLPACGWLAKLPGSRLARRSFAATKSAVKRGFA